MIIDCKSDGIVFIIRFIIYTKSTFYYFFIRPLSPCMGTIVILYSVVILNFLLFSQVRSVCCCKLFGIKSDLRMEKCFFMSDRKFSCQQNYKILNLCQDNILLKEKLLKDKDVLSNQTWSYTA